MNKQDTCRAETRLPHTHKGFGLSAHMLARTLAGRSRCHTRARIHRFLARPRHVSVGFSALASQEASPRRACVGRRPDAPRRDQKENPAQKSTRDIKGGCCAPVRTPNLDSSVHSLLKQLQCTGRKKRPRRTGKGKGGGGKKGEY